MKIAFATEDGVLVNSHFGHATRFDVYEVRPNSSVLVESRIKNFEQEKDKIDAIIKDIADCKIVFINDIGGGAAARVTNARIHPIKVPFEQSIAALIDQLIMTLTNSPAPWLRRILIEEQN